MFLTLRTQVHWLSILRMALASRLICSRTSRSRRLVSITLILVEEDMRGTIFKVYSSRTISDNSISTTYLIPLPHTPGLLRNQLKAVLLHMEVSWLLQSHYNQTFKYQEEQVGDISNMALLRLKGNTMKTRRSPSIRGLSTTDSITSPLKAHLTLLGNRALEMPPTMAAKF